MRDPTSLAVLWTRTFEGTPPRVVYDRTVDSLLYLWPADADAAKTLMKDAPTLQRRATALAGSVGNLYVETYGVKTGTRLGRLLVESGNGSVAFLRGVAAGDTVALSDTTNRVHFYSIASGERRGQVFGTNPALAPKGDVVAVNNGPGRLLIYDTTSMKLRAQYTFGSAVALAQFDATSTRLTAVTFDQSVVTVAVPPAAN